MSRPSALERLDLHLKASYKLIHFCSQEESRAELAILHTVAQPPVDSRPRAYFAWSETQGFVTRAFDAEVGLGSSEAADGAEGTESPVKALNWVIARETNGDPGSVYVMKDLHSFIDPRRGRSIVVRQLKDAVQALEPTRSCIILLSGPTLALPPELEKDCVIIDFELPDSDEIQERFEEIARQYAGIVDVRMTEDDFRELADAAKGLTMAEAELAFGKAVVEDRDDIASITEEKKQIVRKTGILSFEEPGKMDMVGGLDVLKRWLDKRQRIFSHEAREFGVQAPKGVMLTGIPGCGKSLCARAMASVWDLPILRLDMGSVMGGLVGSSEANMRTATRTDDR